MLSSDVSALDELLAPDLIFTNHLGQLLGKEDDLAAHRSGMLKVKELTPSEQHVRPNGDVAIVSVRMQLSGMYDGSPAAAIFVSRVSGLSPLTRLGMLLAAHSSIVA